MIPYARLEIEARSHSGLTRTANEDIAVVGKHLVRDAELKETYSFATENRAIVVAVLDGVGGHGGGGHASRLVAARLGVSVQLWAPDASASEMVDGLTLVLADAHRELGSLPPVEGGRPPGTTCTAIAWSRAGVVLAHAGDSRAYRIRDGILNQLTRDHSASAPAAGGRPALANCLGGGTHGVVEAEDMTTRLLPGDRVVLVTDGVMASANGASADPEALLQAIQTNGARGAIEVTLEHGAPDNCTAILVGLVE